MQTSVTTIERFITDQEYRYPEATGELSNLLYDIALASKIIAATIRRAGLVSVLGSAGTGNVQGEEQQKLDVLANDVMKNCLSHTGRVCVMGSEEEEDIIPVPPEHQAGKYAVLFDPLDGSSNIDVNSAVGTIFSIYRRVSLEGRGTVLYDPTVPVPTTLPTREAAGQLGALSWAAAVPSALGIEARAASGQ